MPGGRRKPSHINMDAGQDQDILNIPFIDDDIDKDEDDGEDDDDKKG